jgi:Xaa-Pro aminopeptidase
LGRRKTKERALAVSGIKTVYCKISKNLVRNDDLFGYNLLYTHYRRIETETREARFVKWWKDKYPAHAVAKSNPILQRIRSVKKVKS